MANEIESDSAVPVGEPCNAAARARVDVHFQPGFGDAFRHAVMGDLDAGLAGLPVTLCLSMAGAESEPLATIRIGLRSATEVEIEVRALRLKRRGLTERTVHLAGVPVDGRAFAVAIAADELLQATLRRFDLKQENRRLAAASEPAPTPTPNKVVAKRPRASRPAVRVALTGAGEVYSGGNEFWGAELGSAWPLSNRLQARFTFGGRRGRLVRAQNGAVSSQAIGVATGLDYRAVVAGGFELLPYLALRLAWASFEGDASQGATQQRYDGVAFFIRSGLGVRVSVASRLALVGRASIGIPARAIEATDSGSTVAGVSGVELAFSAGAEVEF